MSCAWAVDLIYETHQKPGFWITLFLGTFCDRVCFKGRKLSLMQISDNESLWTIYFTGCTQQNNLHEEQNTNCSQKLSMLFTFLAAVAIVNRMY